MTEFDHGHWLHDRDPNECSTCYLQGEPDIDTEIVIKRNSGKERWEALIFNVPQWEWQVLELMPGTEVTGNTSEEAHVNALESIEGWLFLDWHKDQPLLENPFLSGPQKFEIMSSVFAAAERTNLWPDSLIQISPRG